MTAGGATFCPHCGYDLANDEVIELDGYRIDPRGDVEFNGARISLRPSWRMILSTVAKAYPRPVPMSALIERISMDSDCPDVTLRTQICGLRKYLREQGIPAPVKTLRGSGYCWSAA